jgi:CheY-like chemotaxis protein
MAKKNNKKDQKNKKILLIGDDPFIEDIYRTEFESQGIEIDVVKDGEECLKKIKKERFDVLLLDLLLPKVSGWEILEEINSNPSLKNIKVVVLSNLDQQTDIDKATKLGAVKYLIKSNYTPAEIAEEVKEIL